MWDNPRINCIFTEYSHCVMFYDLAPQNSHLFGNTFHKFKQLHWVISKRNEDYYNLYHSVYQSLKIIFNIYYMVNFIKNNTVKRKRGFRLFHYFFSFRHLSEQYFTSSQTFSHFFRHVNGRPQVMQILVGKSDFFFIFMTRISF